MAGAVHVTPALLLSLVTVAVTVTVSFPSTAVTGAVTETLIALMVRLSVAVAVRAVGKPESVITKVSEVAGLAVVAPAAAESTPLVAFRLIPVGSVPLVSFQV